MRYGHWVALLVNVYRWLGLLNLQRQRQRKWNGQNANFGLWQEKGSELVSCCQIFGRKEEVFGAWRILGRTIVIYEVVGMMGSGSNSVLTFGLEQEEEGANLFEFLHLL